MKQRETLKVGVFGDAHRRHVRTRQPSTTSLIRPSRRVRTRRVVIAVAVVTVDEPPRDRARVGVVRPGISPPRIEHCGGAKVLEKSIRQRRRVRGERTVAARVEASARARRRRKDRARRRRRRRRRRRGRFLIRGTRRASRRDPPRSRPRGRPRVGGRGRCRKTPPTPPCAAGTRTLLKAGRTWRVVEGFGTEGQTATRRLDETGTETLGDER